MGRAHAEHRGAVRLSPLDDTTQYDTGTVELTHTDGATRPLEILERIGAGGMGEVNAARDGALQRVVALKVLPRHLSEKPVVFRRFVTEAQVTAQLDHPHIVPVYSLQRADDLPAFSMKLIRGETLRDQIYECREGRGPSLAKRLEAFVGVCDAIAYAHERGVVHRDIKPANIMVGAHGEVYVVDWGVAKVTGVPDEGVEELEALDLGTVHQTEYGNVVGTPRFMSPEQAEGSEIDGRADIYALGMVLHELVALKPANEGRSPADALIRSVRGNLAAPEGPRDLQAIITRATQLERDQRYATATELAEDVRRFLRREEVSARPDGFLRSIWRRTLRRPTLTLSLLFGIVSLAAMTVILSLVGVVIVQNRYAAAEQAQQARLAALSQRAHAIDTKMLVYQTMLAGLVQQAQRMYIEGPLGDATLYDPESVRAGNTPTDWARSERYGEPVSFSDAVAVNMVGGMDPRIRRVLDLRVELRRAFVASAQQDLLAAPAQEQLDFLRENEVPITYLYFGFEDGTMLSYPGMDYGKFLDFDARERPWYRSGSGLSHPRWGAPYEDAGGRAAILVPCNVALYDGEKQIGVAGLDVTMDDVIEMMAVPIEGVTRTWLLLGDGRVLIDSEAAGADLAAGLDRNQALTLEPFPVEGIREAVVAGERYGSADGEQGEILFYRLDSLGWALAAQLE